jgi:all-trans-retinol 13,14-reductase
VGYKVLVLEQHYTVGGSTHTYSPHRDKNATNTFQFDVGVHYVGGQLDHFWSPFRQMFNFLSDSKLEWNRLSDIYDVAYNAETGERLEITGERKESKHLIGDHLSFHALNSFLEHFSPCC